MLLEIQQYRKKYTIGKLAAIIMVLWIALWCGTTEVKADNGNISVSSVTGTKGETVSVSVIVSADEAAMGEIGIAYDTNYLEYVNDGSNGGVAGLVLTILNDIPANQPQTINLNFVLKEAGSTSLTVASNTKLLAVNAQDPENAGMNLSSSNGTVTINAANTASNDSHLSGLTVSAVSQNGDSTNVSFIPGFSPDIYEYTAELAPNVTRLVVATTLSDAKATTQVSGTRIDVGSNKTTITVKAEDGSQSVYTIYTVRPSEATTTAPPETQPGETPEGQTTQAGEPETEFDRTPKLVEPLGKYIIQDFTLISIPEGFEESTTQYAGQTVAVLRGITKGLTLMALADDVQGSNIGIYLYNEASGTFNKMVNVTNTQKIYTVIPTDDSYAGPEGYIPTAITFNGDVVRAWIKQEGTEFYVIYAMNWNGETALYVYDTKEQTMQRFVEGNKSEAPADEPKQENTEYVSMKRQYDELHDKYDASKAKSGRIIKVLLAVIVIALLFAGLLIYKLVNKEDHSYLLPEEEKEKEKEKEDALVMPKNVKYPQKKDDEAVRQASMSVTGRTAGAKADGEAGKTVEAEKTDKGTERIANTDEPQRKENTRYRSDTGESDHADHAGQMTKSGETDKDDKQESKRKAVSVKEEKKEIPKKQKSGKKWETEEIGREIASYELEKNKEKQQKEEKQEPHRSLWDTVSVKLPSELEKEKAKQATQSESDHTDKKEISPETKKTETEDNNLYFVTAEIDNAKISKMVEKRREERRRERKIEKNNQRVEEENTEIGLIDTEEDIDLGIEFVDLNDKQ